MTSRRYYENPSISPLFGLIDQIRQGEILLPRFQRPFVWEDEQRLDLLDSVRQGMPIGSFLVWRTEKQALVCHTDLGGWAVASRREHGPWTYLIDGHQRAMTLLSALTTPDPKLYERIEEGDRLRFPVYYDLSEEGFKLNSRHTRVPKTWMPLHVLLSPKTTYEFCQPLYAAGHDLEARRAEALRDRFSEYWIPVIPMVTNDFRAVAVGFKRINSSSTPMAELHMLHAVIAARGVDLLERLEAAKRKHIEPLGGLLAGLDDDSILAAVKLAVGFGIYQQDPERLADVLASRLEEIDLAAERLAKAARFLSERCGVTDLSCLPYKYQLVFCTVMYLPHTPRLPSAATETQNRFEEWFWRTSFLELFRGISEGRLNQVTKELHIMLDVQTPYEWPRWFAGEVEGPPNPQRSSGRVRALQALLHSVGRSEELLEEYKSNPEVPPEALVTVERHQVESVGLKYAVVDRSKRRSVQSPEAAPRKSSRAAPRGGFKKNVKVR